LKNEGTGAANNLIGQACGYGKDKVINGQIAWYIDLFFLSVMKFHGWVNQHHVL